MYLQHLRLILALQDHDFANVPFLLHTISSLPQDALGKTSDLVFTGLTLCVDRPGPLRSEMMTSPDFWAILKAFTRHAESAPLAFDILEKGSAGNPPAIIADNFEAAVSLLNEFASAAHIKRPKESDLALYTPEQKKLIAEK